MTKYQQLAYDQGRQAAIDDKSMRSNPYHNYQGNNSLHLDDSWRDGFAMWVVVCSPSEKGEQER